jgi:GDPmannose 4,6-dehydratase
MFGIQQKKSFVESDPLNPISPYGISKASAHVICNYFREKMNMNIYCGILFNHESELRSKSFVFRKITSILSEIKNGLRKKLLIGNLEISRDWGYAPEYVEAIYLLMREDIPRDLIIATGETYSLRQVIQKTIDQLRLKCQVEEICEISEKFIRTREIEFNSANPRQAKSVLGWQANVKIDGLIEKLLKFERWISNR